MSSRAAPTLSELQENPMAALSKGWSIFSSAVASSAKVVNESIIQPGMERVTDPNFQAGVKSYVSEASKKAGQGVQTANVWGRERFGVDVAGGMGDVIGKISGNVGVGGAGRSQYGAVGGAGAGYGGFGHEEETSALYHDEGDDAFFSEYAHAGMRPEQEPQVSYSAGGSNTASAARAPATTKKAEGWDDDKWEDF